MDPDERAVYLTFDDGPIPEVTPWVLDLLDKYDIKATFFMVGDNIRKMCIRDSGMSFNSGVIVYIILLAACLIWGVYESYNEKSKSRMALSFILTIAMLGIPFYGHGTGSVVIGIIVIALLWLYLKPGTQEKIKERYRCLLYTSRCV